MNPILNRNLFLIKEHLGIFKAANDFDIYDPASGQVIMHCREEKMGFFTKILRFTDYKRMTPFHIEIKSASGEKILTVKRGVSLFISNVEVFDEHDNLVGTFDQHFFSIGGKFTVKGPDGKELCMLKGSWTGWDFKFVAKETELAHVSKKWAGIGKELFTSADNYILEVFNNIPENNNLRMMILASVLCIDMVLKE
ncbi:MAG: RNAase [Cytophagaceae bacterium]|nr:RNAase [Cytophagaceae bacterium]